MTQRFQWIPFYIEMANKLLTYKDRRSELFYLIKDLSESEYYLRYLNKLDIEKTSDSEEIQIDPFSVMATFNRTIANDNRIKLCETFAKSLGVEATIPRDFDGIPVLNNHSSIYNGTDQMWNLAIKAIDSADNDRYSDDFIQAFDNALKLRKNGLAKLTIGLYLMRPYHYMPLDSNSRKYISETYQLSYPTDRYDVGSQYVELLKKLKESVSTLTPGIAFPQISLKAHHERDNASDLTPLPRGSGLDKFSKNIILYGPAGTGKTYNTVSYAVAIIDDRPLDDIANDDRSIIIERFQELKEKGLIEFTTFHQSYGYEEFIEGIRPVLSDDVDGSKEIEYEIHNGIFKSFCDRAGAPISENKSFDLGLNKNPTVWKVSLAGTGPNPVRTDCLENDYIRIGYDEYGDLSGVEEIQAPKGRNVLIAFYNRMQIGDIVFSCFSSKTIDAIGVITGEPEWHEEFDDYKRVRNVKWLVKDINHDIVDLNAGTVMTLSTVYKLAVTATDALNIIKNERPELFSHSVKIPKRVFIVDEINRGNISKIFGELITLIEDNKRLGESEATRAKLPYSGQNFGVPSNVYIIGTMNTADRSIALIDTALRRRFEFIEFQPDQNLLRDIFVEGISIENMLTILNKRISILLDREKVIGHSYFMSLETEPTLEKLGKIFANQIIPHLQEYFYDDYEKIRMILGDNQKEDESTQFILEKRISNSLFGTKQIDKSFDYEINPDAFTKAEAYEYLQ